MLTKGTPQFDPPLEEMRRGVYEEVNQFVALPASFKGLGYYHAPGGSGGSAGGGVAGGGGGGGEAGDGEAAHGTEPRRGGEGGSTQA